MNSVDKDLSFVVKFGAKTITFYPLNVKHIRNHPDEVAALMTRGEGGPFAPERFTKLLKLYTLSAQRGDASITDDDVESVVDMGNIKKMNKIVLGQDPYEADDDTVVKEVVALRPTNALTGSESTAG